MRTPKIPRGARHLRTYAEFESYLVDFVNGLYPFVWIFGRPGIMKTESIRAAAQGHLVCNRKAGQLTPTQFYIDCFRHLNQPIILDDVTSLLDHRIGRRLISALGDTGRVKLMSYGTTSRVLGDVPPSFFTASPLCVISNRPTAHEDIQSRATVLYHDPTNLEIHRKVATWYWDQQIHDWFGEHLYRLLPLDTRWYLAADRDKRANRDWSQILLAAYALDPVSALVQDLETSAAHPTREDKARRFLELRGTAKGASRATYFRLRQRLEVEERLIPQVVPPIRLGRTRPPDAPSLLELESMEMLPHDQPEEESHPLDVPAREAFAQPVRGHGAPAAPSPRVVLDDSVAWERPAERDEEEDA